jgi:hypothetical protein
MGVLQRSQSPGVVKDVLAKEKVNLANLDN